MNNCTRRGHNMAEVNLAAALVIHNQSSPQGHNDAGTHMWHPVPGHWLSSCCSALGGGRDASSPT